MHLFALRSSKYAAFVVTGLAALSRVLLSVGYAMLHFLCFEKTFLAFWESGGGRGFGCFPLLLIINSLRWVAWLYGFDGSRRVGVCA